MFKVSNDDFNAIIRYRCEWFETIAGNIGWILTVLFHCNCRKKLKIIENKQNQIKLGSGTAIFSATNIVTNIIKKNQRAWEIKEQTESKWNNRLVNSVSWFNVLS